MSSDLVYLGGRHKSTSRSRPPLPPTVSARDTSPGWGSAPRPVTAAENRSSSAPSRRPSPLAISRTGSSAIPEQANTPRERRPMASYRPTSPSGPSVSVARKSLDPKTHQQQSSEPPAAVGVWEEARVYSLKIRQEWAWITKEIPDICFSLK